MNLKIKSYIKKLLIVLISFAFMCSHTYVSFADIENEEQTEIIEDVVAETYKKPQLASKYAICIERTTETILFENSAFEKTAMASTTKIMTAILAIEKGNLDDIVKISKKAAQTHGLRFDLEENMEISLNDLLYGLMLRSRKRCCRSNC